MNVKKKLARLQELIMKGGEIYYEILEINAELLDNWEKLSDNEKRKLAVMRKLTGI